MPIFHIPWADKTKLPKSDVLNLVQRGDMSFLANEIPGNLGARLIYYGICWHLLSMGYTFFFYKQLGFQFQPGVANGFCIKQAESCLGVSYHI